MKIMELVTKFEVYLLAEKRVSENTLQAYKRDLYQFVRFIEKEGQPEQEFFGVQVERLRDFLAYLHGCGLSARSIARKIAALKSFFAYVEQFGVCNNTRELIMPKLPRTLPKYLSEEEIEGLFAWATRDASLHGRRNMIMLYLLYITGVRVSELVGLTLSAIQLDDKCIYVDGKGDKQRIIPIPDGAVSLIAEYINIDRGRFVDERGHSEYLFPSMYGGFLRSMSRQSCWFIVKRLCKKAGIERSVSPHMLRHSFATHMLKRGANIRALQLLLGHEHLATVQTYTHVDTSYLRMIYDKKHPRSS